MATLSVTPETRTKIRFGIAKCISRGGDLYISYKIEAVFGGDWFWYLTALAVGGIYNVGTDWPLQKFWVDDPKERSYTWKETGRYTTVRVYFIPLGLAVHAVFYYWFGLPFLACSIFSSMCLAPITYRNTRGIFSPRSTRWVPWPLRSRVLQRQKDKRGSAR